MKSIFQLGFLLLICNCQKSITYSPSSFSTPYKSNQDIQIEVDTSSKSWKYQSAAWSFAEIGAYQQCLATWDASRGNQGFYDIAQSQTDSQSFFQTYQAVTAIDYILEKAKDRQIVIINEAHHQPKNRVFTRRLLSGLKDLGFKHIGFEALDEKTDHLTSLGYPTLQTGFYTREPQFANLLREAIRLDYSIFPYESTSGANGRQREIEQANNIKDYLIKILLDQFPNDKIIIHCGFAHAYKGEYKSWEKAMAGRLQEFTGIEPLTIDQQVYTEKSERKYERKNYRFQDLSEPTVFLDKDKQSIKLARNPDFVDIVVFHDRTKFINKRPHWLFYTPYQQVDIDLSNAPIEFPCLVAAYVEGEDLEKAIPVDQLNVNQKGKVCLSLSKGAYQILLVSKNETVSFRKTVK